MGSPRSPRLGLDLDISCDDGQDYYETVKDIKFTQVGFCERCETAKPLSDRGVCQECLKEMVSMKGQDLLRSRRLKKLNQIESGLIQEACRQLRRQTVQHTPERKLTLGSMLREREERKLQQIALRNRIRAIFDATPRQLAELRRNEPVKRELVGVNEQLMRWLAKHPEYMRELPPRKFEEVIAEILRDLGYTVQLTPATRDGGRDIIVGVKTSFGELLVIVECKRWCPPHKVGLAVVERFLHVLRDKTKANLGVIAATTTFTLDAQKSAQEFSYLLKLADFDHLKEMAKNYGTWHRRKGSEIWVPNYSAVV